MRGVRTIVAALALGALAIPAMAEITLIRAERVIVDASKPALGRSTVAVRDGKILGVRPGLADAISFGAEPGEKITVIDLGARTLLPGLIDGHVHLSSEPGRPFWLGAVATPQDSVIVGVRNAATTVRAGFTTVRDLGAAPGVAQALRNGVKDGSIIGPRIQAAGPALSIIGGHADPGGPFNMIAGGALSEAYGAVCTGAVECAARVRELSKQGVDVIKFAATGGVLSQQNRGFGAHFSQEEMNAIVSTAHLLGLKVASHAHGAGGVAGAAKAGVDSIEHGTFIDAAGIAEMKKSGAMLAPTLMPAKQYMEAKPGTYTPVVQAKINERVAALGKNVKLAKEAGVPIAFATDAGVYAHGRNAEEFAMLVRYGGMTPRETLVAATLNAAKLLGLEDEVGVIAAGKSADFVAVAGDPLADVTTLEKPHFVMAMGRVVRPLE
jgi:imidazolonepropionase-like amidohydrolase